jgi:hypothetical protein
MSRPSEIDSNMLANQPLNVPPGPGRLSELRCSRRNPSVACVECAGQSPWIMSNGGSMVELMIPRI